MALQSLKLSKGTVKMDWTKVNIFTTAVGVDPLCGCLLGLGINGFEVKDSADFEAFLADKTGNWDYIEDDLMGLKTCETCVTIYLPGDVQGAETLLAVRSELVALKSRDEDKAFGRLELSLGNVREEDWANNWKQYFKPFSIGERLVIKPSWEEYEGDKSRIILEIDPASSFGTGQHHTTRLCLELLEKYLASGDKVLDLGCGSGILSIGAVLLGASAATAVDIEAHAAKTAAENAIKNHIAVERYTALCGNVLTDDAFVQEIGGGFDVIVANIVADVLIAMSGLFGKFLRKGGVLIVSGIISERKSEVSDALIAAGYSVLEVAEDGGWAAIALN